MNRLWIKLSAAFLVVALAAIGVVAVTTLRVTDEQFRQYMVAAGMGNRAAAVRALTDYYATQDSWAGVETLLADLSRAGTGMGMMMGRGMGMSNPSLTIADSDGRVVAGAEPGLVGQMLPASALSQGNPLVVGGREVGVLLALHTADVALDPQAQAFLDQVRRSLVWAGLGAAALSLVLGVLLSRLLTAPLAQLTRASQAIAAGDLTQRVAVRADDETAALGRAFNDMAESLAAAETQRKNLIADVSHELRTPLTVIQGDLQAILDGVYPLEMAQVASLYDETRLLTRLVDDLHDLALADAGQLRIERLPVDMAELGRAAVAQFAPLAEAGGVRLSFAADDASPPVEGDPDRLGQVLRNLLSNALRHTSAGGEVTVRVATTGDRVELTVADTGSGIAAEDLPHVFDRFYRGNRTGHSRGAGLGLAIARQLALAHGGELTVASRAGEGTQFTMRLPQM